jgi:hypothetical protein
MTVKDVEISAVFSKHLYGLIVAQDCSAMQWANSVKNQVFVAIPRQILPTGENVNHVRNPHLHSIMQRIQATSWSWGGAKDGTTRALWEKRSRGVALPITDNAVKECHPVCIQRVFVGSAIADYNIHCRHVYTSPCDAEIHE